MASFGERLRGLRKLRHFTQKEMADMLHITERAYQRYENDSSTPHFAVLITLADFFDVSIDYLVGRSDDPKRH